MGKIKKGDFICGTNGSYQTVLEVVEKGQKEIYKVFLSDGRIIECCDSHLWTVNTFNKKQKTLATKTMVETGLYRTSKLGKSYKYFIPNTFVEMQSRSTPIDPYILGCLLGDGSLSGKNAEIELSLGINKKHIIDYIETYNPEIIKSVSYVKKKNYYRVKLKGVKSILKDLNLLGTKSATKFIPSDYLYNDKYSREQLLKGLLDTDGYINSKGRFEFSTISTALKDDFLELVRGLGYTTHYRYHNRDNDPNSYSKTPIHRVTQLKGYDVGLRIQKIVATGQYTDMRCLFVSNEDSLYITNDYVSTHNTTLTSVLLNAIYTDFIASDLSPQEYIAKYEPEVESTLKNILDKSNKLDNLEQLRNLATIAGNSASIGDLFHDLYSKIGFDSQVELERSRTSQKTYYEITSGIEMDEGYLHPAFITDKQSETVTYENPIVYISTQPLKQFQGSELFKIITSAHEESIPVVIIAPSYTDSVMRALTMNKVNQGFEIVAIKTPGYGYGVTKTIEDLQSFLSANDRVQKVVIKANKTIFYNDDTPKLQAHLDKLQVMQKEAIEPWDEADYKNRYYKLKQTKAIIYVGGVTTEIQEEEYDRVEDARGTVQSSIKGGFVEGAGKTLAEASTPAFSHIGLVPAKQIHNNAGIEFSDTFYNVKTLEPVSDLIEEGIIDSTLVIYNGLKNSWASAKLLINTNYIIHNELF